MEMKKNAEKSIEILNTNINFNNSAMQEYFVYDVLPNNTFQLKEVKTIRKKLCGYEKVMEIFRGYQETFDQSIFSELTVINFKYAMKEKKITLTIQKRIFDKINISSQEFNIIRSLSKTVKELEEIDILRIEVV